MIKVDFGNSVGVYIETLNGWLSEAGISPVSATDRERVISGIVAGLEAMGRVKRVERSNWNSNPKRSESLRRFAERLRRTRVENAENVASSRRFLGILEKTISKAKRLLAILEDRASIDPRASAKKLSRCSSSFARYQI
jgi:hypothetical protein